MLALTVPLAVHSQEIQTVKIGISGPLSGPQAASGIDNFGGAQMAAEKLNAQGVVVAGKKLRFELVSEDDQADPRQGVAVAQKLVDMGVKGILGPNNSGVALPASKIYNDAGVVVATVASNPKVTLQKYPAVFRIAASDSQLGGKLASYAAKKLNVKTVYLIDDRTAYGQGLTDEFEKIAKASGIKILGREFTTDKATEFLAILTTIKAQKPDAIFFGGYAPQGGPMVRQMKQLGIKSKFLGGDGICMPEMGRLSGDAAGTHIYCTQGGAMLDRLADGKAFASDYSKKFSRPPEVYAASFYDGLHLIAGAMKTANSIEPKIYSKALEKVNYKGIAGVYTFDENHDLKESPVIVFQFKGQEPVALESF
jgi:ABC-type branched-subunit amino acid transport system substrate-binding protein